MGHQGDGVKSAMGSYGFLSDTFKPMGPKIVSGIDPMNQLIEVRVNGRTVSSYNTAGMIFSVGAVVNDAIGAFANRLVAE